MHYFICLEIAFHFADTHISEINSCISILGQSNNQIGQLRNILAKNNS
jgi:hypothetical protein